MYELTLTPDEWRDTYRRLRAKYGEDDWMLATVGEVGRLEAWTQVVDSEVLERLVEIGVLEGVDW